MKNILLKLSLLTILFTSLSSSLYANDYCSIVGFVKDAEGQPIEMGNVFILAIEDSSLIKGDIFFDGKIELGQIEETNFFLVIRVLGYQEYRKKIIRDANEPIIRIGEITLGGINLAEVLVTAQRLPVFRQEGGKMIVDVANSLFSEGSDAVEILKKAPRVMINDGSVSIFGKGAAVVLVDGVKVASNDVLSTIPASEILKIEIISNPSAKYDAEGNAVINIITKRNKLEGINTKFRLSTTKATYMRYKYGAEMSYRKGKWNLYTQYSNRISQTAVTEKYNRTFTGSGTLIELKQAINKVAQSNSAHGGKITVDYTLSEQHIFGAKFGGAWYNGTMGTTNRNDLFADDIFQFQLNSVKDGSYGRNRNTGSFNYTYLPDTSGTRIFASIDHTTFTSKGHDVITETIGGDTGGESVKYSDNLNKINIDIAQLDFTKPIKKFDATFDAGMKITASSSQDDIVFSDEENTNDSSSYQYDEKIVAGYIAASKSIGKVKFEAGLRAEYTSAAGISGGNTTIDSSYVNLFPSAAISYAASANLDFALSYSKRIARPTLQDMDPFVFYIDSFSVIKGNPLLVPTISNSFEASITYMKYASINVGFTDHKNAIFPIISKAADSPVTVLTQQNVASYKNYFVTLNIPYQTKKWTTFNSVGFLKNVVDVDVDGENVNFSKPMWYFYAYNKFSLPAKIKLEATFVYYSSGIEGIFNFNSASTFSFGVSRKFLGNKLNVTMNFNDVFRSDTQSGTTTLPTTVVKFNSYHDSSYFRLSASYKFGKIIKSKSKSSNSEELDRIKVQK